MSTILVETQNSFIQSDKRKMQANKYSRRISLGKF